MKKIGRTYIFESPPLIIGSAGVQSKKENKDDGNDFGVCVCTDQQLSACEIADIYKLTDSAKL